MGQTGQDRKNDNIEFNVADTAGARISLAVFAFPGGRRFHFLDPDGYELAVWSAA
ncbi:Glyoxalase family protein [plant metagenome]|uniref:Glyoxalase family protein n=1 Tax=plant metagenome TaxID=1297885 RepID=A0A484YMY6_9ZZZZ